jgi:hypothetical protein
MVAMVTMEQTIQFSKVHLTYMNLSNFKIIEAMGLTIIALRSP